jgi:hypothetical protein
MSSRSSIFLSDANEHWYNEQQDESYVLEFGKEHKVEMDGEGGIIVTVAFDSHLWRQIHYNGHRQSTDKKCLMCPGGSMWRLWKNH